MDVWVEDFNLNKVTAVTDWIGASESPAEDGFEANRVCFLLSLTIHFNLSNSENSLALNFNLNFLWWICG